ncbi:MAG: AAA family ATPase [Azospirillaceae bacterium]|nr:AAA family ATPase [Azospirillaceae bacterium]
MAQDQQADVIAFLADPAAHDGDGPVEIIETHASLLFLAGPRVVKLKRAVRRPYLDYSTRELRHNACLAEFRLNRRISPELYRGVRAVWRRADGTITYDHEDAGTGVVLDWVVVMNRFDEQTRFDRLARRGDLTPALLIELAGRIVDMHRHARPTRRYGGAGGIEQVVALNETAMAAAGIDPARAGAVTRTCQGALDRLSGLLERRRRGGRVRRCHGDLHLANLCLVEGRPTPFDCLEFDPALGCIDVLYDLAFLLMDLGHYGLSAAANLVFNRYLDLSDEGVGDSAGLPALPLFVGLRAVIRGHIAAAQAATAGATVSGDVAHYLDAAQAALAPVRRGVVAIGGLSGSGKSTLARALAPRCDGLLGARVLRTDVIRKRAAGLVPEQHLPASAYDQASQGRVYGGLIEQTVAALAAGFPVIADAVFLQPSERGAIAATAAAAGVPFLGLWLDIAGDQARQRIGDRVSDASDATPAVFDFQQRIDPGVIEWHRVDAGGGQNQTAAAATALLTAAGF